MIVAATKKRDSKGDEIKHRLDSWKEIAAYLKRSPRTVRRWEHEEALPVHRHLHGKRGTVYAITPEVDEWLKSRRVEERTDQPPVGLTERSNLELVSDGLKARLGRPMVIAVLPLGNLSNDRRQERFVDGLTEELILEIGRCSPRHLRVIASTSAMQYKQSSKSIGEIGRELHVDYILEGGVRRYGRRVRLTARLIAARDQANIWADSYEIQLPPIVSLQQSLARQVADSLSEQFHAPPRKDLPTTIPSVAAYNAYLEGKSHFLPTDGDIKKRMEYLYLAIRRDPKFASSYVELALSYFRRLYLDYPPIVMISRIEELILKALKLESTLASAHTVFAASNLFGAWNWARAEKSSSRAIKLNPSSAWAQIVRAAHHVIIGHVEEATEELAQAHRLDPQSAEHGVWIAILAYLARRYDYAIERCKEILQLDSSLVVSHGLLGLCYAQRGDLTLALSHTNRAIELGAGPFASVTFAKATACSTYALAGEQDSAGRLLQELVAAKEQQYMRCIFLAQASVGLGDEKQTLEWLEKAFEQCDPLLVFVKADARFDPLAGNPKFRALLRRIGLPT